MKENNRDEIELQVTMGFNALKVSRFHRKYRLPSTASLLLIVFVCYVIGYFTTLRVLVLTEGSFYNTFGLVRHPLDERTLQEQDFLRSSSFTPPLQVASPKIDETLERKVPSWKHFHNGVTLDEIYPRQAYYIPELLRALSTERIISASILNSGTQIKFLLKFADGNEAVAKPKRHPRDFYWAYNRSQPFWLDEERHTAEIASFHLDRILDYRRVSPCVGRKVNFIAEILQNSDDPGIFNTLRKQNGRTCFIGNCVKWFCNEDHPVCDENGGVMELSVCQMIREPMFSAKYSWTQEEKYSKVWKNKNVCTALLNNTKMTKGRFFLDVIENSLFDHLIVNFDRHHIIGLGFIEEHRSLAANIDNGKGFGNPFKDDITFLAPVYQCCRFRNSTYQHILSLTKEGNKLGELMKSSLASDPLAPLLTDEFFPALDRRLAQFIEVMDKCIERLGPETVLVEGLEITG